MLFIIVSLSSSGVPNEQSAEQLNETATGVKARVSVVPVLVIQIVPEARCASGTPV